MRRSMFAAALTAAVVLAAATGAGTANAPSPSYQVAGVCSGRRRATQPRLPGPRSTGDRGFWRASVATDPLTACSTVGSSCAVTGGTLALNSNNGSQITGTLGSGGLALTAQASGCGTQQFNLNATFQTAGGAMELTAVVTEYRLSFRRTCLTLGATVQGSLGYFNGA